MSEKLLFFLLVIVLFTGCSSDNSSSTDTTATETTTITDIIPTVNIAKEEENNIPLLLKKPEPWGNAPNFATVKIGGEPFKLSSLSGKVVLLNFWSVGCPACKLQIPVLGKLYKQYEREKLEIVGVCLEQEAAAQRFIKTVDINYILVLLNQEIANKYGRDLRFIPVTFIIDQQGNIAEKHVGLADANVLEKEIKELLEKTENR